MTIRMEGTEIKNGLRKKLKLPEGYDYFLFPHEDPQKRFYHVSLSADRTSFDSLQMARKISSLEQKPDEIILPHVGGPAIFSYVLGDSGIRKTTRQKIDSYPIITNAYGDEKKPGKVLISDLTELSEIIRGDKPGYKDGIQKRRPNSDVGDDIFDRGLTYEAIRAKLLEKLGNMQDLRIRCFSIYVKDGASLVELKPDLFVTTFPNSIKISGDEYKCWVDFPWDNPKYEKYLEEMFE